MGNNFIFTGDDGPKKQDNHPKRHRGRRKSRKQIEDELKKKTEQDWIKNNIPNAPGIRLAKLLIYLSIPIAILLIIILVKVVPSILVFTALWLAKVLTP